MIGEIEPTDDPPKSDPQLPLEEEDDETVIELPLVDEDDPEPPMLRTITCDPVLPD